MSGWASLSGYLFLKPGGGGLSILKARKRLWCILEESQGKLLYYKSEEDARSKPPLGYVELRGAAITLDMDNHNQFVIIVDSKEILLTAENHESMMIWMMALQARRDQFALGEKSRTSSTSTDNDLDPDPSQLDVGGPRERSSSDLTVVRDNYTGQLTVDRFHHRPLEATKSLQDSPMNFLQPQTRQMSLSMEMAEIVQRTQPPASSTAARAAATNAGAAILNWSSSNSNSSNSNSTDTGEELYTTDNGHRIVVRSASARGSPDLRKGKGSKSDGSLAGSELSIDGDRVSDLEKELIATKCELAKVLNRQTCFQEILMQKDEIIEDLDEKLGSRSSGHDGYDSKKRVSALSKEHQERVRVLQNQNRFLNEEVRRLAKLRGQEHDKMRTLDGRIRGLEGDIEVWKLEYISLIQSSIRFTGSDTMDDAELSLFGGDRHKIRIMSLLEEARRINPSLPTYEHLASGEVHVDCYGFKHQFVDDGLLLHYLCQELSQHFLSQASSHEKHQKNWMIYLKNHAKGVAVNKKDLKSLVRGGIPDQHRKMMWRVFVMAQVEEIVSDKGAHYYRSLCNAVPDSPLAARYRKQISLDLMRTMPSNVKFSTPGSKGIMDLQDVLLAFCLHNPAVGYCQGMNFLVAMALLFMDAQDAFWTLVAVTERYHSPSYFDHNLLGAQADQSVLHDLMAEKLPVLTTHLDAIDIEISTVTLNWFLALFFDAVPFQTLLRIWDVFLLEGPKVLFRFSLAVLHLHSKEIVQKADTISVMRHLKACARISYDADGLVHVAFRTLKPFPRRHDIVSKQTFYLNALKEKYRWRDLQRLALQERENAFQSLDGDPESPRGFECCTVTRPGEAWVVYGSPPLSRICIVDCHEQTMTDTEIVFETRVLSIAAVPGEMVLLGTLDWCVYAYSQNNRELLWEQRVHDAVLCMQVYRDEEGDHSNRLFAAMADGTVAVFENITASCASYDLLYLPIGQSQVTCLQLLGNQLWCSCGNTVSIIHASTLDPMDRFTVSANPYDTVLSLVPGLPGVWLSVRGSSVLELWDPMSLSCKMLYDTRTGRYPNLRKEDDTYFNNARITSILALDHSVWVGTGEGTLITFDVFTQGKTPSDSSPFMTEAVGLTDMEDSQSWLTLQHKGDTDSLTRLVEVEKRVKDLYCQRLVGDSFVADTSRDTSSDNSLLPPSAPLTPRGDGEGDNSSTVSSAAGVAPPAGKLTSGNRSEKDNAKVRDNSRSSSDQGKPAGVKNVREGSRNIQNMRREAAGGQNGKTSSSSNSSKVKSKTDRSSSGSAGKASVEKKLSTGSNKTDVSVTSNVLAETDDNSSAVTKMSSAVSGSHTSGAVSQNDSGYAKTGSFSSTSSCAPDSTSLNNTLVADRSSDEGKGQDESVSNGHLPEPPSVYYLYRPDMEKDEPKRKDSGSDQSVAKTDSGQGLARGKNSTSRLMQEGRTKNKSEDSGVSSITDDNIPNAKEKKDNENAKKISSSSDRSSSNKHLPSDKLNGVQTSEQIKNMKNRLKNSGSSDPGDDFQKENNLECCINKGSRFYSNGDSDISSMSQTEDNAETAECEGNASTDVVLSDKEEAALGDSLKVDEKTSSPPADDQNVDVVVVPGQRSQTSQSLESNGRSVSEDSNKTCGSDDVFSEDTPIDTSLETPTQDGSHANPPPGHGRSSEFESPEKDVEDTSFSNSTTPCGGDVSVPNGHCVNGYLSDKHGSQEDDVVTTPVERAVAHRNSRRSTLANVRSLAAQFEAKVKDNSVESPSSSPTKLRSPTRPVGVPESLVAPRNGSLGKERTGVERPSSLPLAPNGHTKLRRVVSNPVGGRPRRFAGKSETFSQFYVELHKAPTRDTDVKEIGLKDCQAKLCSKSEMLSPEDSSRTTATTPSTVTETESVASNADIDTKFYGDSDEETCVHEARVQSFKNTYKKLSSVNAPKFRPQTEIIPENDAGSGKDLTPSIPEKQSVESTAPTPAADSIGGGDASITSDVTPQPSSTTPAPSSTVSSSTVSVLSRKRTFSSSSSGGDASRLLSRKDSDVSSIQDNNMQSRDPEAQWRLDYTNVHVDTDADSTAMSSVSEEAGEGTDEGEGHLTSATGRRLSGLSTSSDVKDQRLSQFLKDTAASFSTQFGHSLEEDSMSAFLNTPTMSCNSWSSYDEISTPPCADVTTNKHNGFPRSSVVSMGSRSTSIASTMDLLYSADLSLMSKNKIADKPVKWLLNTEYGGKPVVLSFCGSHSDDEAVLIWSREDDETLWTNCPVLEYNPITRTATLPRYMRPHLSSSSSTLGSPKQRPASVNSN